MTRVRNDKFDASKGLVRGRSLPVEVLWYVCKSAFFLTAFPWPMSLKRSLLTVFGGKIGEGVVVKPRVNIHFPWKLRIGAQAWLGEEVFILNFEPVSIGAHACISQRAFLCTGNHDFRDPAMSYRNRPITVGDGAWVGAQCFVGPGVTIGVDAVATAGSVVVSDLPPATVCSGNPCAPRAQRWNDGKSPAASSRA
jgi:putative colanic acid biosynthesis acetyltransferase WcaF